MKTKITIFLFSLFLFAACNQEKTESATSADTTQLTQSDTAKSASAFVKDGDLKFFLGQYIDSATTRTMVNLYIKNRKPQGDSESVWFDMKEMEGLLAELKKYNASGLRIYLAMYPNSTEKYPNKTTVILAATFKNGEKEYDLINNDNGRVPTILTGLEAYNHGNLCPGGPNCP